MEAFILFIITYYLGLVGFKNPSIPISFISSISLIFSIIYLLKNVSILTTILIIILYLWSINLEHVPVYGSYVVYNPFSIFGIGQKFYGEKIKPIKTCSGDIQEDIEIQDVEKHNLLSKLFSLIITVISTTIYTLGVNWIGSSTILKVFTNIRGLLIRTGMKGILGYVPKNKKLEKNWFNEYMQYRVDGDDIFSRVGAMIRRITLMGIDMNALDSIFEGIDYNNVPIRKDVNKFCEERSKYFVDKNVSIFEKWKWETLPYLYHWVLLSAIIYLMNIVIVIMKRLL